MAGRNHVLWTGCKSNQTSADAWFDGQYFGAFTFHYLKVMRATKGSLSRQAVITQVREAMKGAFTQVPQLEGHASNRQRAIAY